MMKKLTRNTKKLIKDIFVVAMAVLCIVLLTVAVLTFSKTIFMIFGICSAAYWGFIFYETVIKPALRMK